MSQTKVSALNELTTAAADDLLLIADTSETESKKIQKSNITEENFTSALKTKLDGIETGATADQSAAEIKTAYESNSDTNAYTDAEKTKLSGIETNATADQTAQEIATAIDADATAETTLKSALGLGTAAYTASTDYATAAQGSTADSALQNVSEDTTPQLGGDLDTNGNDINFGDNDKAQFGASNDLQIYHDGSNSYITDAGTGGLYFRASSIAFNNAANTETITYAQENGAVTLYYDGSSKLATTSTGIDVTGTVAATAYTGDGSALTGIDALPSQTGNADKYLTTDGTNASWADLDTDANTTTKGLYEHAHTISANYSITSGNNAMSAGPVTVDTGYSVTVPSGSVWTIV